MHKHLVEDEKLPLDEQKKFLLVVMSGVDHLDFDMLREKLNPESRPVVDELETLKEVVDRVREQPEAGDESETLDGVE